MSDSFVTPWALVHEAPLSTGFSRQEYWSGLPFPSPGDLPGPGIEPASPALQVDSLPSKPPGKPQERDIHVNIYTYMCVCIYIYKWCFIYIVKWCLLWCRLDRGWQGSLYMDMYCLFTEGKEKRNPYLSGEKKGTWRLRNPLGSQLAEGSV